MQIELTIEGKKKIFTAPFVPMMARRKYFEIEAKAEEREVDQTFSARELIEEENETFSILVDIVFEKQFTIEELINGASKEYVDTKLTEAVFGVKPKKKKAEEGNDQGK